MAKAQTPEINYPPRAQITFNQHPKKKKNNNKKNHIPH